MILTVYGLEKCSTCQKARNALAEMGYDVDFRDVRADGIPDEVLMRALDAVGARKLINRASYTWRGLTEAERDRGAPLDLMKAYPALMKRPLIDTGAQLHAGWTKAVVAAMEALRPEG